MFKPKSFIKNTMNKKILVISIISLLAISILSQDVSASVLSASMKNPPQATADLFTLNNTAGIALYHINNAGKVFAANNADFHNSTVAFDSSKILIRNPASTFAYTVTGGAIVANRTLNIPVITTTDTLAVLGLSQTFSSVQSFSSGIQISSGQKINLDGATGNTYVSSPSGVTTYLYANSNLGLNVTAQGSRMYGYVADGSAAFALDAAGSQTLHSLANSTVAWQPFGNSDSYGGLFLVEETAGGREGLFLVSSGGMVLVSQSGTIYGTTANTNGKINVYVSSGIVQIQNLSGSSEFFRVMAIRMQPAL